MMQSKGPLTKATKKAMEKAYRQAWEDEAKKTNDEEEIRRIAADKAYQVGIKKHKMDCQEIDEYIKYLTSAFPD